MQRTVGGSGDKGVFAEKRIESINIDEW